MSFWKKLGHSLGKVGRFVGKTVTKLAPVAGTVIGTAVGMPALGAAAGNLVGSLGSSSSVPEITQAYPSTINLPYKPELMANIATPGFMGGELGTGGTWYKDGTVVDENGRRFYDKELNDEIFGSPTSPHGSNSSSGFAPLLLGIGGLILLSD